MIILATAVILALSSNGIIGKANKAKTDSDAATLKEYINVLKSEWELMPESDKVDKNITQYVNEKLEEKGYLQVAITEDGKLYTNLQDNAKEAILYGLKIGDEVTGYSLDESKSSCTTSGKENTAPTARYTDVEQIDTPQTVNQTLFATWKYIGIGDNGEILIAPDMISGAKTMKLSGKGGFVNGASELNAVCEALYSTSKGTARSIDMNDLHRVLNYTGPKGAYSSGLDLKNHYTDEAFTINQLVSQRGELAVVGESPEDGKDVNDYYADGYSILKTGTNISATNEMKNFIFTSDGYWLASSSAEARLANKYIYFGARYVRKDGTVCRGLFSSNGDSYNSTCYVRPVVSINSDVSVTYNAGTLVLGD